MGKKWQTWNILGISSVSARYTSPWVTGLTWNNLLHKKAQKYQLPITALEFQPSSNVLDERNRHLLDIQYHWGVGLFLILLIVVEQNLLTAYDHILQIFLKDNERKTDTALKGWTALSTI